MLVHQRVSDLGAVFFFPHMEQLLDLSREVDRAYTMLHRKHVSVMADNLSWRTDMIFEDSDGISIPFSDGQTHLMGSEKGVRR